MRLAENLRCGVKCFQAVALCGMETLMSKGPGRIERAIEESLVGNPDQAPTTEELCEVAYPGLNQVEKKHRVAVIRAAKNVCLRVPGWGYSISEAHGGTLIWWNRFSVTSYALLKIKKDWLARYRSNDPRIPPSNRLTPEQARSMIEPGGKYHHEVVAGGHWHRHVRLWTIERDGDTSPEALAFKADSDRIEGKLREQIGMLGSAIRASRA